MSGANGLKKHHKKKKRCIFMQLLAKPVEFITARDHGAALSSMKMGW